MYPQLQPRPPQALSPPVTPKLSRPFASYHLWPRPATTSTNLHSRLWLATRNRYDRKYSIPSSGPYKVPAKLECIVALPNKAWLDGDVEALPNEAWPDENHRMPGLCLSGFCWCGCGISESLPDEASFVENVEDLTRWGLSRYESVGLSRWGLDWCGCGGFARRVLGWCGKSLCPIRHGLMRTKTSWCMYMSTYKDEDVGVWVTCYGQLKYGTVLWIHGLGAVAGCQIWFWNPKHPNVSKDSHDGSLARAIPL